MRFSWQLALLSLTSVACGSSATSGGAAAAGDQMSSGSDAAAGNVADAGGASDASDALDAKADDAAPADASPEVDAAADAGVNKAATCAATFGSALTNSFGRLDGTVVAVVPSNDQMCAEPNMTHLVVQVMMGGAVYRIVVDVLSDQGSPNVLFYEMNAPLAGGAWADGWHTAATLDYVSTLNVHSTMFTAMVEADLVAKITSEIELSAKISVFATSAGEADSAHLVHRNTSNADGAIVIGPDSATPHYLLMHFDEQTF